MSKINFTHKRFSIAFIFGLIFVLMAPIAFANTLLLNTNGDEFKVGESLKISGYILDSSLSGVNSTTITLKQDSTTKGTTATDSNGYYEYYINNLSSGTHTIESSTSTLSQTLGITVYSSTQIVSYEILANSLEIPFSNPQLNFTVKKYAGTTLSSDSYSYDIYYDNGTLYTNSTGTSGVLKSINLPSSVGNYKIIIDNKKSFSASVIVYDMFAKITDLTGVYKDVFKPNGVGYFEVQGFSNGQKITNATITAIVTDPTGAKKTVIFTSSNGLFKGNTNVTKTTPIQLKTGDYEVEFIMEDSSGNKQSIIGTFSVLGISVDVNILEHKAYKLGDVATFDVIVKDLSDGTLISNSDITYSLELVRDGEFYDISGITTSASTDSAKSSKLTYTIPTSLEDGDYFLKVIATTSTNKGKDSEFFEVSNVEGYLELTDNYDNFRQDFKPGESAKVTLTSNKNISSLYYEVLDNTGNQKSNVTKTGSSTSITQTFNVPQTQGDYLLSIKATTTSGKIIFKNIWFKVKNYVSYLDVKNMNNNYQFELASGETFLSEINVFDVNSGDAVDISNFVVKFDKIVNEETGQEYTNFNTIKNTTLSDGTSGKVVYDIIPSSLSDGIYRIDYTIVDDKGNSINGNGWFGISAFEVGVSIYDSNGLQKNLFSTGDSVNISIVLSSSDNGTATIHREYFSPITFNITNGNGSYLLTSKNSELPSEEGFYNFGIEVTSTNSNVGLGDGFFEIQNLNVKSISVRSNGKFSNSENITADVTVEKSGNLLENANISISRIIRARDNQVYGSSTLNKSSILTSSSGRATLTFDYIGNLEPGQYYADVKIEDTNGNVVFDGFGFEIVENIPIITINDADKIFSSTDTIEVNVKVVDQNNNVQSGVSVNVTGFLNFNTWAPKTLEKQTTTASNGIATLSFSAANFNPGYYAPIINIEGLTYTIIGFGDGEFQVKAFTSDVTFSSDNVFNSGESIVANVNITGTATVTAKVYDMGDNEKSVDYSYFDGVLTVNNNLGPGQYFLDVAVTQSSNTVSKRLWFEIISPWTHIEPLTNPSYSPTENINISYETFTFSANGKSTANATINITNIENMWTGAKVSVGNTFNANGTGTTLFDLTSYSLGNGDYLLNLKSIDNSDYDNSVYFRVEKNVTFILTPNVSSNNVTITINTTGMSSPQIYLDRYLNYDSFTETEFTSNNVVNGTNSQFTLSGLLNGFYEANLRIVDGSDTYYSNAFFDVRVKDVTLVAPSTGFVGNTISFNITATSANTFWLVDPFSQIILLKQAISSGTSQINYSFTRPGGYMYSYGNDKRDAFFNAQNLDILDVGFNVEWSFDNNRFVNNNGDSFIFNVTSDITNTNLTLEVKNFFTGEKTIFTRANISTLVTNSTANQKSTINISVDNDLNLSAGPHDVQLILEDGSSEPPRNFFFMDIFATQYDIRTWNDNFEYKAGNNVTIKVEIYDVTNNWNKVNPTSITLLKLETPDGLSSGSTATLVGSNIEINTSSDWSSGMYFGEVNVTKGSVTRTFPIDFFIKGNDNLELYWQQNNWDFTGTGQFNLTVDVRENGVPAVGVSASLVGFGDRPKNFNTTPTDLLSNITTAYNLSNSGVTDSNGQIILTMNLTNASLPEGGYTGKLKVGGQYVWFDFGIQNYGIEAYTNSWEYGNGNTIELVVRARNIVNWNPLTESGTVTIKKINKIVENNPTPVNVSLSKFGITNSTFDVLNGNALINMIANITALNLSNPADFEVELEMNLASSGKSNGFAWFRQNNDEKASITILDRTGSVPDPFFGGQNYTLVISGVSGNLSSVNIWGPQSSSLNISNAVKSGTDVNLSFITPDIPGRYDVIIGIDKGNNFTDNSLSTFFTIGSGTEMHFMGESNIVPNVNFSIVVELFGKGDDPFCANDPNCTQSFDWFGPLGNKNISFIGVKDLETFTFINKSGLGIVKVSKPFNWTGGSFNPGKGDSLGDMPGSAVFTFNSNQLNLSNGKKYNLIFEYDDGNGSITQKDFFVQVEIYHIAISKRERNIKANSVQSVWLKTTQLNGTPISSCNVTFDSIYNDKDFSLVKTISVAGQTDNNGTLEFSYTSPALPGGYMITGISNCGVGGNVVKQDIGYFIDVGSKNLDVDMKTKFKEGENIVLSFVTKDNFGKAKSQTLAVEMQHDRKDYSQSVFSSGGTDCVALDASQAMEFGGGGVPSQPYEVITDTSGTANIEFCPMPKGSYMINVFPVLNFNSFNSSNQGGDPGGPGGPPNEELGFFGDFIVSSGKITVVANSSSYIVGDNMRVNLSVIDDNGNSFNGTLEALEVFVEIFGNGKEQEGVLYSLNSSINVVNGSVNVSFKIPSSATSGMNSSKNVTVGIGPISVFSVISDSNSNKYSAENMVAVIKSNSVSKVTAPSTIKINSLIKLNVVTTNSSRYKVQSGVLFLKDNANKMKEWFIDGGVFLENNFDGTSSADVEILSPKEPGEYFLAFPIFDIASSLADMSYAKELLIVPIDVTLDQVNVSGRVTQSDGTTPIEGAIVRIGKVESITNASGDFTTKVPKGKKFIEIEKKISLKQKQLMRTSAYNFVTSSIINVSFYEINLNGSLPQLEYNFTVNDSLSTMLLNLTLNIDNNNSKNLTNAQLTSSNFANSDKRVINLSFNNSVNITLDNLYAGFISDNYDLKIKFKVDDSSWNSTNAILVNGTSINSSINSILINSYKLNTNANSQVGNGLNEDQDFYLNGTERIDEEIRNNKDDDGDGLIDEDLEGVEYIEICGNGICGNSEIFSCNEDCFGGAPTTTCSPINSCIAGEPFFCDNQGFKVPDQWCGFFGGGGGNSSNSSNSSQGNFTSINLKIMGINNNDLINTTSIFFKYNLSGNLSGEKYNHTQIYLDSFSSNWSVQRVDSEGILNYTFSGVSETLHAIVVKLFNTSGGMINGDSVNISVNTSSGGGGNFSGNGSTEIINITLLSSIFNGIVIEDIANNFSIGYDFISNSIIKDYLNNNTIDKVVDNNGYLLYNLTNFSSVLNLRYNNETYNNVNGSKEIGVKRNINKTDFFNLSLVNITNAPIMNINYTVFNNSFSSEIVTNITTSNNVTNCDLTLISSNQEMIEKNFIPSFTSGVATDLTNYSNFTGNVAEVEIECNGDLGILTPDDSSNYTPFIFESFKNGGILG